MLEAGGTNDAAPLRSYDSRWSVAFTEPLLDWGYKSVPQPALANQEIPLARGKGLGGSSAINFAAWLYGHREDFNEWAERVGDSCWSWENVWNRFKKVERIHVNLNEEQAKYLDSKALNEHSKKGRVDLTFNKDWPALEGMAFEAAKEMGVYTTLLLDFSFLTLSSAQSQWRPKFWRSHRFWFGSLHLL